MAPNLPRFLGGKGKVPTLEPDGFPLPSDDPLRAEHGVLSRFLEEYPALPWGAQQRLDSTPSGEELAKSEGEGSRRFVLALQLRLRHVAAAIDSVEDRGQVPSSLYRWRNAEVFAIERLLRRKLPMRTEDFDDLLEWAADEYGVISNVMDAYVKHLGDQPAPERHLASLRRMLEVVRRQDRERLNPARMDLIELLGEKPEASLVEGEAWSDAGNALEGANENWGAVLKFCMSADAGKPAKGWQKTARQALDLVDPAEFEREVVNLFSLVDQDAPEPIPERNECALKGLAWLCGIHAPENPEVARALTTLALAAFRKVPARGPRALKVGNACLWALGELPGLSGVAQLAILKTRVRHKTALKGIEKALTATAERVGMTPAELEEMGVPTYGLTEVGRAEIEVGEFDALLEITSTSSTALTWRNRETGKVTKTIPAAVKRDHAEELKEVRGMAADLKKMLPAQRDRIDGMYLEARRWPIDVWRERYLDHPLIGWLSSRLLWRLSDGTTVLARDGQLEAVDGSIVEAGDGAEVALWHPLDEEPEAVLAWRARLADLELVQPFKQAHREIYVLTDAERATGVYSNRFAAHILKQHQYNALCAVRGWRNALRMLVDDDYPPTSRELPAFGLRAEFWVEGIGDDWEMHTNDAGTFLYLATDQVRFYAEGATQVSAHASGGGYRTQGPDEPVPLTEVPALVLSEVLRDVDLFVGVASIGNDPAWQDGGRDIDHGYWHNFSFGELSETARTRRELLQALVPKLKIADRCSFEERFLVVRGDLRTYRIHLGSGNVLMEPDSQYLCIVTGQLRQKKTTRLFLPFEGDGVLSIILSKAMLLAEDVKITDETIRTQLGR